MTHFFLVEKSPVEYNVYPNSGFSCRHTVVSLVIDAVPFDVVLSKVNWPRIVKRTLDQVRKVSSVSLRFEEMLS
jgi:hypothetical protein